MQKTQAPIKILKLAQPFLALELRAEKLQTRGLLGCHFSKDDCRSGLQPTVENLPKGRHGSGGLFGGFLQWIFWSQNAKENLPKKSTGNPPAENKKESAGARPPQIRQPGPKIRHKTYKQSCLSSLQVHAGFFDWEGLLLEAFSEHGFRDTLWLPWSRLPCWNAPAIPQLLLVGVTRFAVRPSRQYFWLKVFVLRKRPKNNK